MIMKVVELAKELVIGAIELVEKLREKGIQVRNHMASIDDEIVLQVRGMFSTSTSTNNKSDAKVKVKAKKTSSVVVAKKVIRRKARDEDSKDDEDFKDEQSFEEQNEQESSLQEDNDNLNAQSSVADESVELSEEVVSRDVPIHSESNVPSAPRSTSTGLRIVKKAPAKPVESLSTAEAEPQSVVDKSQPSEIQSEKPKRHIFTPVYIPSQDKSLKKTVEVNPSKNSIPSIPELDADLLEKNLKKEAPAKRLGGLASMMSTAEKTIKKAEQIKLERAEEELKSY